MMPIMFAALVVAVAASGHAVAKPRASKAPRTVGTDPTGDWGSNAAPVVGPVGQTLGVDLVRASIGKSRGGIRFVIEVAELPESPTSVGGLPAGYVWDFIVGEDDGVFELASCEPSWAIPNDLAPCASYYESEGYSSAGTIPFLLSWWPPQDGSAGIAPRSLDIVEAELDYSKRTLSMVVPLSRLGSPTDGTAAERGSIIGGSTLYAEGAVHTYSLITTFSSDETSPIRRIPKDVLDVTEAYRIP